MNTLKNRIAAGLLALALMPATASAMGLELSLGAWNQAPRGDISFNGSTGNDNLNLKDDLRYDDRNRVMGRVKIVTPLFLPNIYLMATPSNFKATGNKNTPFQFGNSTFAANAPFTSELRLDHYDFGLYYGIPGLKTLTAQVVNIDLGVDARVFDFKARVTGQNSTSGATVTESKDMLIAIPMVYVGLQIKPLKWLAIEGEGRGMLYRNKHYYDAIGRLKIKPFGPLFAAGGYRYERFEVDMDSVRAKAVFDGPFAEAGIEF
jgi:outer membrane protein